MRMRKKPIGFWRCVVAADWAQRSFVPGSIYECRLDPAGTPRVYSNLGGCWAPYWQAHNGRFCYPPSELDFEYLGESRPREPMPCANCARLMAELEQTAASLARASEMMGEIQREMTRLTDASTPEAQS